MWLLRLVPTSPIPGMVLQLTRPAPDFGISGADVTISSFSPAPLLSYGPGRQVKGTHSLLPAPLPLLGVHSSLS